MFLRFDDGRLGEARAQQDFQCDNDTCELEVTPATGGWIMPEVASSDRSGRNSGRFRLEFGGQVIEGTYDTAHDGPNSVGQDGGPGDAGSSDAGP